MDFAAGDGKRARIRAIATKLGEHFEGDKVFFDEFFSHELAGGDTDLYLQRVYGKQTRLVVSCVCKRYDEKPWTRAEWRAIRNFKNQLSEAERLRFLPLRFGDGEIEGMFPTVDVITDAREMSDGEVVEFILKRLNSLVQQKVGVKRGEQVKQETVATTRTLLFGIIGLGVTLASILLFLRAVDPQNENPLYFVSCRPSAVSDVVKDSVSGLSLSQISDLVVLKEDTPLYPTPFLGNLSAPEDNPENPIDGQMSAGDVLQLLDWKIPEGWVEVRFHGTNTGWLERKNFTENDRRQEIVVEKSGIFNSPRVSNSENIGKVETIFPNDIVTSLKPRWSKVKRIDGKSGWILSEKIASGGAE